MDYIQVFSFLLCLPRWTWLAGCDPGAIGHVSRPLSPPLPSHFHQWNRPAANIVSLFNCLCGCKTGKISKTEFSVLGTSLIPVLSCWILSGRPHAFLIGDSQAFLIREELLIPISCPAVSVLSTPLLDFLVSVHLRFFIRATTLNILWRIFSQDTSWAQRSHTSYGDASDGRCLLPSACSGPGSAAPRYQAWDHTCVFERTGKTRPFLQGPRIAC